jgi:hypothetical protein
MKILSKDLLLKRKEELKRRSFLRGAPAALAFLLAAGAQPVHATEPIEGATTGEGVDPI